MNESILLSLKDLDTLILVPGHAVYVGKTSGTANRDKSWVLRNFQKGEPPCYIEHVRIGVELAAAHPKSLLVFSGGQTRLEAGQQSEAASYRRLAEQFEWWQKPEVRGRAVAEEFARDSYENLLFAIARFRETTGRYPNFIHVVNWGFKRERFNLHRCTVRWPGGQHFIYHSVNNPNSSEDSVKGEAVTLAAFEEDPFGTQSLLRTKRAGRNPFQREVPYAASCADIAGLIRHRTADGMTFKRLLPWDTLAEGTLREKTAHSWAELQDIVQEAELFLTGGQQDACKPREFWYRGHGDRSYTLTPSLFRFRESEIKEGTLFDLYSQACLGSRGSGSASWRTAFKMQHYGVPTRLLDWTADLEIAVFFAVAENRDQPCIFVLNPRRLNAPKLIKGVPRVPKEPRFDYWKSDLRRGPGSLQGVVAVAPTVWNPRLRRQDGRFTIHGKVLGPLEYERPDCLFRIWLTGKARKEAEALLEKHKITLATVFPDAEGITKYVTSLAALSKVDYDEATAGKLLKQLSLWAEEDLRALLKSGSRDELHTKGVGSCNVDPAYIRREDDEKTMDTWLTQGPPLLIVTGEAGVGKTNFIFRQLLCDKAFEGRPFIFFSFKLYGASDRRPEAAAQRGIPEIWQQLYENAIGKDSTEHEQEVLRRLIADGSIVLALDGLDELARNRSQEAAEAVARELEAFLGGSHKARVILSCRDHIFQRLEGLGILVRTTKHQKLVLERFDEVEMRKVLTQKLGPAAGRLARIATIPLFYEMIRQAGKDWHILPAAHHNSTLLEKAWFEIMLKRSGYPDPASVLHRLGDIAGAMLVNRSDLLKADGLEEDLATLMQGLSKPGFPLFVEEQRGTYSFSHQALREFVLAWRVAEEIKTGRFNLLKSGPSFDYEGAEFYSRVNDLLDVRTELIPRLARLLRPVKASNKLDHLPWNHLARNLFEMVGETMPHDDAAKSAVRAGIRYLNRDFTGHQYISYKAKYNVARCLERCHYSARRPYFRHILKYDWANALPDYNHFGAYAIRGFHMKRQRPGPLPPTVFNRKAPPPGTDRLERDVSRALIAAIERLQDHHELPEEAQYFAINCTHALIRWLPERPDLGRLERLLGYRHVTAPMRQNIFWALYRRYRKEIPPRFVGKGFFRDCGPLAWHDNKSWAPKDAIQIFEALLLADSRPIVKLQEETAK